MAIVTQGLYAQGIEFFQGTYEEAKTKAKKENKKIFVDAYTTWCGPCKKMAKEVFPTKEVGDYFNKNFICMKLDAENEKDHGFFKDYKATSFPTYFWVDADGILLDKQSGSTSPSGFIQMAQKAVNNKLGSKIQKLKERWEGGERNAQLVRDYVLNVLPSYDAPAMYPAMIDYLNGLSEKELNSIETFRLFTGFCEPLDGRFRDDIIMKTYFANIKEYEKYEPKYSIENLTLSSKLYRTFVRVHSGVYFSNKLSMEEKEKSVNEAIRYIKGLDFVYKDMYAECIEAEQLLYKKDYARGIQKMEQIVAEYGEERPSLRSHFLYTIIMSNYCLLETKPMIENVVKLATDNLKAIPGKTAVSYYAAMQYAAGNAQEAYSAMAWSRFYGGQELSNAVFAKMNIRNIREKFPTSTTTMEQAKIKVKELYKK